MVLNEPPTIIERPDSDYPTQYAVYVYGYVKPETTTRRMQICFRSQFERDVFIQQSRTVGEVEEQRRERCAAGYVLNRLAGEHKARRFALGIYVANLGQGDADAFLEWAWGQTSLGW